MKRRLAFMLAVPLAAAAIVLRALSSRSQVSPARAGRLPAALLRFLHVSV